MEGCSQPAPELSAVDENGDDDDERTGGIQQAESAASATEAFLHRAPPDEGKCSRSLEIRNSHARTVYPHPNGPGNRQNVLNLM